MASTTTRLGLRKPAPSDAVDVTADLSNNYDVLDASIGIIVCTNATRPSVPFVGLEILETDTGLTYLCTNATGPVWTLRTKGITVVTSGTRPDSAHAFIGMMIYETDTALVYFCVANPGPPTWILYPRAAIVCTSITRPPSPVVGTLLYETDTSDFVICLSTTGPVWVTLERGYVYGGKDIVHSANITATGNNATEVLINNMDSGTMDLLANTRYKLHVKWLYSASVVAPANVALFSPAAYMMRIRDTNVSGTIRAQQRHEPLVVNQQYYGELTAIYETTVAETGKLWVFSCARITGTTTPAGVATFVGGGTGMRLGMEVINLGHAGQLTQVTS